MKKYLRTAPHHAIECKGAPVYDETYRGWVDGKNLYMDPDKEFKVEEEAPPPPPPPAVLDRDYYIDTHSFLLRFGALTDDLILSNKNTIALFVRMAGMKGWIDLRHGDTVDFIASAAAGDQLLINAASKMPVLDSERVFVRKMFF